MSLGPKFMSVYIHKLGVSIPFFIFCKVCSYLNYILMSLSL